MIMKRIVAACFLALTLQLGAGSLTFEKTTVEADLSFEATSAQVEFKFKNGGKDTVVIDRVQPGCPCLTMEIKGGMVVAPGKEGVIRATMDTAAMTGVVDKPFAVFLKGDLPEKPSQVLTVRVNIPELVSVEPKALIWDIGGDASPKKVVVTMNHSSPIKITSVSGADGKFKQEWKAIEEGKKYEITVTPVAVTAHATGVIRVVTDCTYQRHKAHNIFAVVKPAQVGKAP
jgi:hypothetical protein